MPPPGRRSRIVFGQLLRVVDQIGAQFGRSVEADDHHPVLPRPHHAVDELDRRFLLELEALANAVAGVDQDRQAQRQVAFRRELLDYLRLLVLDDFEIILGQVGDEAALLVRHGEQHVDARDVHQDARALVGRFGGFLFFGGRVRREPQGQQRARRGECPKNHIFNYSLPIHSASSSAQRRLDRDLLAAYRGKRKRIRRACRK